MPTDPNNPETAEELKQNKAERRAQLRLKLLSERDIIEKGVIYSAYSRKILTVLTIILGLIALYLVSMGCYWAIKFIESCIKVPEGIFINVLATIVFILMFMLVPAIVEIVLFRYIIRGYACDYEANHVQFCITRKGKPVMSVIYKNAESVEYKPMKYLWFEQGFHVTVNMKSYSLKFDYVVPRAMRFHTENFPFEIIIREIVQRKIGEQNAE